MSITLPGRDSRTAIIGSTGSGKTQFSVWLLSKVADIHRRPWFILDMKGDELLGDLGAKEISIRQFPKEPGLYIIRPIPGDEYYVSEFFYKCWLNENVGIYIDEGYMVPKGDRWFLACLTQGRSKHVQMIVCSQRPVFLDKFVWTESNYFVVFNLTNADDRKKVGEYMDGNKPSLLTKYHSLWYDIGGQNSNILGPVPSSDELIEIFDEKLDDSPIKL